MGIPVLGADDLRVTHPFASRSTEVLPDRLACIRHAASVHPEPGSNSQNLFIFVCFFCFLAVYYLVLFFFLNLLTLYFVNFLLSFQRSVAALLSFRQPINNNLLLFILSTTFFNFFNIFFKAMTFFIKTYFYSVCPMFFLIFLFFI